MADADYVRKVAIVGAGGRLGKNIVEALIRGGRHRVTAITRPQSTSEMPAGLHEVKQADYDNRASLVEAMRGQDALIITMSVFAPGDSQHRLIDAAAEAGVSWIMPNEWGNDLSNEQVGKDVLFGERFWAARRHIEKVGRGEMHWIGLACSFWYEFSLAGGEARYGFDFDKKTLTFFGDGNTKLCTSTWAQCGRAVASLLSLKVNPEINNGNRPYLSYWKDKSIYIASFPISQKDMFSSVLRVTGGSEKDWTVSYIDVEERYRQGVKQWKERGDVNGFVTLLYSRMFFKDAPDDYRDRLDNHALGLPEEDLDEATRVAVEMAKTGATGHSRDPLNRGRDTIHGLSTS